MSGHNKKAASAESFIKAAQLFHEKKQLIKGIKPQGKPVCILWLKQIFSHKFFL